MYLPPDGKYQIHYDSAFLQSVRSAQSDDQDNLEAKTEPFILEANIEKIDADWHLNLSMNTGGYIEQLSPIYLRREADPWLVPSVRQEAVTWDQSKMWTFDLTEPLPLLRYGPADVKTPAGEPRPGISVWLTRSK